MNQNKSFIHKYLDKSFYSKTLINSTISFYATLIFGIWNGLIGINQKTLWNISLCIYLLLLTMLRYFIISSEFRLRQLKHEIRDAKLIYNVKISYFILLIISIFLFFPVFLILHHERSTYISITRLLIIITYTIYKLVLSVLNIEKSAHQKKILIHELRTINLIDAFVSLLTLNDTLYHLYWEKVSVLSNLFIIINISLLLAIILSSVLSYCRAIRLLKD